MGASETPEAMDALRAQLMDAARTFSEDDDALSRLLSAIVEDIARARAEAIEIVPVSHHSPASALHMVQRLNAHHPRVIFMEGCEDLQQLLPDLAECRLPIALQAFASESEAFPADWAPLTVVAPVTEFSAEYQAMAYAMTHEDVELVFVDRTVDHIFQNIPQEDDALAARVGEDGDLEDSGEDEDSGAAITHGSALGVQVGDTTPTIDAFVTFLLRNAHVRHFAEWWDQYVEQAALVADWETYRDVMFLVGSLLRRLGRREEDVASDRWRERYMWTRMKAYLAAHPDVKPSECMYICGAIHAVSDVEEFGSHTPAVWDAIPPVTSTRWLYGMIPSSYSAIERQFRHPPGTLSIAEATWKKGLEAADLASRTFRINRAKLEKPPALKTRGKKPNPKQAAEHVPLPEYLADPPRQAIEDQDQLLNWCVEVVKLARKNGYLTSTADSIAIYETSMLLANLRNRRHPSPYDFRDAAITCLEKERVPKKRDIGWLCDVMIGGDRTGRVGYSSMPQLAQDVYDRLGVLPIRLDASTIQRALMDFKQHPEWLPCSDLLWKLHYLIGHVVRPIMGERTLGHKPIQESWDISIGKHQASVIQLGYEGVTVEQVLEFRLKKEAFGPHSNTVAALKATEDSILFLKSPRLTGELGARAVTLLLEEVSGANAPEIFDRVRRLVHYYRASPGGLEPWIQHFVQAGYAHYSTLLPESFQDGDTSPNEIAAMLGFIFTLESLALSLGCDRSQLQIAVRQADGVETTPDKVGLLWAAQYLLGERTMESIRAFFDEAMDNELVVPALPAYISGFVLALRFTPLVARLVVELLSKAFARLPDRVLMPWLPRLIMSLKPVGADLVPMLLKDASQCYPSGLGSLDGWEAPWDRAPLQLPTSAPAASAPSVTLSDEEAAARALLFANQSTPSALAAALGLATDAWTESLGGGEQAGPTGPALSDEEATTRALLLAHRTTANALATTLGEDPSAWTESLAGPSAGGAGASASNDPVASLLRAHPATMDALS